MGEQKTSQDKNLCCGNKRFPFFAVVVLAVASVWFLNELKILTVEIPWFPLVLIVIALGWVVEHYRKK